MKTKVIFNVLASAMFIAITACSNMFDENSPLKEETDVSNLKDSQNDTECYCWFDGKKIPLYESQDKVFILYRNNSPAAAQVQSLGANKTEFDYEINIDSKFTDCIEGYFSDLKYSTVSVSSADILKSNSSNDFIYIGPYYTTTDGSEIRCSNLLYVKLKSESDFPFLEETAKKLNVIIVYQEKLDPFAYTLFCTNESKFNALQTGNMLYETGRFKYAHAGLGTAQLCSVNDTYFSKQWYLYNKDNESTDIDYLPAMEITSGNPDIRIAIIDDGVARQHPDMPNIEAGYDAINDVLTAKLIDTHGTSVAGVIAAAVNNNQGVAGIAPDCKIVPFR